MAEAGCTATGRVWIFSLVPPLCAVFVWAMSGVFVVAPSSGVVFPEGSSVSGFILTMCCSSLWLAAAVPSVMQDMVSVIMIHPMNGVGVVGVVS